MELSGSLSDRAIKIKSTDEIIKIEEDAVAGSRSRTIQKKNKKMGIRNPK